MRNEIESLGQVSEMLDGMSVRMNDLVKRLEGIRENLILQAVDLGWKREELEAKLEGIEK